MDAAARRFGRRISLRAACRIERHKGSAKHRALQTGAKLVRHALLLNVNELWPPH